MSYDTIFTHSFQIVWDVCSLCQFLMKFYCILIIITLCIVIWYEIYSFFPDCLRCMLKLCGSGICILLCGNGYVVTLYIGQLQFISFYRTADCFLCCWGQVVFPLPIHLSKSSFHQADYKYQVYGYTTLFTGRQHPITIHTTGYLCVVLVLSVICNPFTNSLINFYFITIIINTKHIGKTRHFLGYHHPHSIGLFLGVRCFGVECNLFSFYKFLDNVLFHDDNYKYQVYGYDTTLFIGQQHPITVYRTGFWVCVVLVFSVICVPLANPLMKLYFIMMIILLFHYDDYTTM